MKRVLLLCAASWFGFALPAFGYIVSGVFDYWSLDLTRSVWDTYVESDARIQARLKLGLSPSAFDPVHNIKILGTHGIDQREKYVSQPIIYPWKSVRTEAWHTWAHYFGEQGDPEMCYRAQLSASARTYPPEPQDLPSYALQISSWRCTRDRFPWEGPPDENCPIVLDLQRDGYDLTGSQQGVTFDIDADGDGERIGWTSRGDDDSFLCMDRNANGRIDDGEELFGWATPLQSGQNAWVGFVALAELDSSGPEGTPDGKVSPADPAWESLCTWNDSNHNGVSEEIEVRSLGATGVTSLRYSYTELRRLDGHGNAFRYVSTMTVRTRTGDEISWPVFDVVFVGE